MNKHAVSVRSASRKSTIIRFLNLVALGIAAFITALMPSSAHAAEATDPQQMIRSAVDQVLATAYDTASTQQPLHERLRPVLEQYFDFTGATRRAIGPGWRNFSPEQQQRAIDLLTILIIRTYSDKFEPGTRPTISYGSLITLGGTRRELTSTVTYAGKRYSVNYRVEQLADGKWRIYDLIIEGVSMIANYRAQLDPLYTKGGAAEVIRSLERSLQQPVITDSK